MATRKPSTAQPTTPAGAVMSPSSPPQHALYDHSFTLQAIMELQKSTGQLTEAVNGLRSSIDKIDVRMDSMEDKLSGVTHKIYAAGVVLTIVIAVSAFFVNKAWDLAVQQITQPPTAQTKH